MDLWTEISQWVVTKRTEDGISALETNFVLGCFPDLWRRYDWHEAVEQFTSDLRLFGVREG
jgi:hypothetical protein